MNVPPMVVAVAWPEEGTQQEEEDEESTDKVVLARVPSSPSSFSSSTAARFLPHPLVCLDAAVGLSFRLDINKIRQTLG